MELVYDHLIDQTVTDCCFIWLLQVLSAQHKAQCKTETPKRVVIGNMRVMDQ